MKLALLAFGKLKTPGLREAADYYKTLLRPYAPLEELELKPQVVPEKSAASRLLVQEKESTLLTTKLSIQLGSRGAYYILDETGRPDATLGWVELVRRWEREGVPVALCIGSSLGFHSEIRARARGVLSLGPQTLSHELARVVLLEQLYRAWSFTRGHPYHNEGA